MNQIWVITMSVKLKKYSRQMKVGFDVFETASQALFTELKQNLSEHSKKKGKHHRF